MLILEDGTGVSNANSYADVEFLDDYAGPRGLPLPITDEDKEKFLIIAFDYLQFRLDECECEFPEIPIKLKRAQAQLVVEQQKGTKLFPDPITSSTEGYVTEKTVGPLTKKYASNSYGRAAAGRPILIASVELFLKSVLDSPFCRNGGRCKFKKTIRV